jgi:hypothetical protein
MTWYRGAFVTLNQVLTQFGMTEAAATGQTATQQATIARLEAGQNTLLKQLILDVSDEIAALGGDKWARTFVPFQHTYTVYPSMNAWTDWRSERGVNRFYFQNLEYADLLSLTSVSFDGTAQDSAYYRLEGAQPYEAVTFDTVISIPSGSSFSSKAEFTGIWGYHQNYAQAWRSVGTLLGDMTDSATSFSATTGTIDTYSYLKIGIEFLFVSAVTTGATDTITVERGARGTTAAAHTLGDTLYAYQQMPEVMKATRRRVINLMQKRAEFANLVVIGETTAEASTEDISLSIPKRYVPVKSI